MGNCARNRRLSPVDEPVGNGAEVELIVTTPGSNTNDGARTACPERGLAADMAVTVSTTQNSARYVAVWKGDNAIRGRSRRASPGYGSSRESVCATIIIGTLIDSLMT